MSLRNYLKKLGKRKAGVWGRINHKRDMRAESKAIRKQGKQQLEDDSMNQWSSAEGDAIRSHRANIIREIDKEMTDLRKSLDKYQEKYSETDPNG